MKKSIKKYLSIYKGIQIPWFLLFLWMIVSVLETRAEVKTVTMTASIIDASQNAIKAQDLLNYIWYLALTGILTIGTIWFGAKAQQTINLRVRIKLWDKIMRLPLNYYDTDNGDELVTRVTTDTDAAHEYFSMAMSSLMSVYGIFVVYRQLFAYQRNLAMWTLLIIPITIILGILYCILGYKTGFMVNRSLAASIGYLADRVRDFKLIKSFGMEEEESKKGNAIYRKQFRADNFSALCLAIIQVVMQVIACSFLIISFVVGGRLVAKGEITIGRLVGFYSLSGVMSIRMSQIFMNMGSVASATGSLRKIAEIFEETEEPAEGIPVPSGQKDIRFTDVEFGYDEEVPVLRGLNCVIPAGRVTALLGTNGAGKSTVMKLLTRMYEPESGGVYFGDENIQNYNLDTWRRKFAVVAQDNPLMSGTIRDNILYGVEREVSEEELIRVAKLTNIYDFVMEKPGGFDAEVSMGGCNFSGGQRQCLAIARAMLRGSEYILLDEVTSNLDVKSARIVQDALEVLMKGRTVILIAHSIAAARNADHVLILDSGRAADAGTPEELLERNAFYQRFAKTACFSEKMGI